MWSYLGFTSNQRESPKDENDESEESVKQRLRLVVRVTVTNARELASVEHKYGCFVGCCAPTHWIDDQVNETIGQEIQDELRRNRVASTWSVDEKGDIVVVIRDTNRYLQTFINTRVENQVRSELTRRGVQFKLKVSKEYVDINKMPKRLVARITFGPRGPESKSIYDAADAKNGGALTRTESHWVKPGGVIGHAEQATVSVVSSVADALVSTAGKAADVATFGKLRGKSYSAAQSKDKPLEDAMKGLEARLVKEGYEVLASMDTVNKQVKLVITSIKIWGLQLLALNRVRDFSNSELKKLDIYAIEVQVSREMVPELVRVLETEEDKKIDALESTPARKTSKLATKESANKLAPKESL